VWLEKEKKNGIVSRVGVEGGTKQVTRRTPGKRQERKARDKYSYKVIKGRVSAKEDRKKTRDDSGRGRYGGEEGPM